MPARILVVDDEKLIRWSLRERLTAEGYDVVEAPDGATARKVLDREPPDLALFDLRLPDVDGMDLLREAQDAAPDLPVLVITAHSTVNSAVEAMKEGAFDYITKPFNVEDLVITIRRALETYAMRKRISTETRDHKAQFGLTNLVGESPAMRELKGIIARVARSEATTVLLLGETGTGKGMAARAIHYESQRAENPFLNITCTALPENLLESELFGHERGAFTDAKAQKKGLFELAHGGTILLDEVGDMPPALQAKLLRVLEEKAFRRIGGTVDITVDVRIIAATNRDLEAALQENHFREDFYYRLSTMPIYLPPLREHREDIPLLVEQLLQVHNREFRRQFTGLSRGAMDKLLSYHWPGNVREFRNVIERAVLLAPGDAITADDIVLGRTSPGRMPRVGGALMQLPEHGCDLAEIEKELVRQALERVGGNQTRAATLLGLTRDQIRYRLDKFELKAR